MLISLCCLNGFHEELVMRGYFIPRFEQIFGSTFIAVTLSSLLFGAYHAYLGWRGVLSATVIGLIYGVVFARFRRLWPLVVASMH